MKITSLALGITGLVLLPGIICMVGERDGQLCISQRI